MKLSRRDFLKGAGGLSLAYIAGCGKQEPPAKPEDRMPRLTMPSYDTSTVEGRIAKELSKWEPWILEVVETDYTNPRKPVRLCTDKSDNLTIQGYGACYDPQHDLVVIPHTKMVNGTFDHEVAHHLTDSIGTAFVGPLWSAARYEQTLEKEIKSCQRKLSDDIIRQLIPAEAIKNIEARLASLKRVKDGATPRPVPNSAYQGPSEEEVNAHVDAMHRRPEIAVQIDDYLKSKLGVLGVEEYVYKAEEQVARTLSSLMIGYTSKKFDGERWLLPLREEDLAFFEQMKWNGLPMFGKAIAKYRLKLEMHKDGVPEEQIKDLAYATGVSWKGKNYSFPALQAQIKNVPEDTPEDFIKRWQDD